VFESLREKHPNVLNKVHAVVGDITEPGLGISQQDEEILEEEVSVVFHSAATVNFDEALTKAVAMNVESVQAVLKLCKKMKKLESLVHVSTAYANCDLSEITEEIYPPPGSPQGMVDLCKWMDKEKLNDPEMTAKFIGNRPNTYTFTKAMAETVLLKEAGSLPISIVRPSIVVAAWKEPMPGWVDNLNGPTGILAAFGSGILKTLYCYRDMVADIVPVDIPINLMCAVAWKTAVQSTNEIPVYNCTSGTLNPIRWRDMEESVWAYKGMLKNPMTNVVWYPSGSLKNSDFVNKVYMMVFQWWPAYIIDSAAWMIGKKSYMIKINNKLRKAGKVLEFFTTHEWRWTNKNVLKLQNELTETDKTVFNFNIQDIEWPKFQDNYMKGIREFVFKGNSSTLAADRSHLRRLYWANKAIQIMMFVICWRLVLYNSETASQLWNLLFELIFRFARMLPIGDNIDIDTLPIGHDIVDVKAMID
jgi:fatty acyl-CoA reductase